MLDAVVKQDFLFKQSYFVAIFNQELILSRTLKPKMLPLTLKEVGSVYGHSDFTCFSAFNLASLRFFSICLNYFMKFAGILWLNRYTFVLNDFVENPNDAETGGTYWYNKESFRTIFPGKPTKTFSQLKIK